MITPAYSIGPDTERTSPAHSSSRFLSLSLSLCVRVVVAVQAALTAQERLSLAWSETKDEIFFFGIIDIFTQCVCCAVLARMKQCSHSLSTVECVVTARYTQRKRGEHFCCGTVAHCGADISCQPADRYGERCASSRGTHRPSLGLLPRSLRVQAPAV
jgi:hypothetical protein